MDYIKEYQKFVSGYYFNEGIRITFGITMPAIVASYLGHLETGLILSLGAMAVSASDIPGPIHQRRNGMAATILLIFVVSVFVGFVSQHTVLMGIGIAALCFSLSFIGAYGARVNAIGFAGMLIMILNLDYHSTGTNVFIHSMWLAIGGCWYTLLSLALFGARPYKIIQQALGENIMAIGDYFATRALFYNRDADYDSIYKKLMEEQEDIQSKQALLREMLFKSRRIVKETTVTGRALLIIFVESIDLFEKASATFYNYESMHKRFDDSNILPEFQKVIYTIVEELHNLGLAIQGGKSARPSKKLNNELRSLQVKYEAFVEEYRHPDTFEALVNMRKLLQSIEEIGLRIYTLHHYTRYDSKKINEYPLSGNFHHFVTKTNLDFDILKENFSIKSNTFRHSIRVTLACVLGYIIAHLLHLQYSYWVLLTIIVILRPTYSVTRQRNYHRLIGTFVGALGGLGLLYIIPSQNGKFAAMIVLMIINYSFMRTMYLVSVIFMTAFVLIFFYLLNSHNFYDVFKSRLIDTAIGSIIALASAYILVPSWERRQINTYLTNALLASIDYFQTVADTFSGGEIATLQFQLRRKDAFIEQANLSGGFTRMMNEPKSKQGDIKTTHQIVVLIYTLNSHIVSLAAMAKTFKPQYFDKDFNTIKIDVVSELQEALSHIQRTEIVLAPHLDSIELKAEMEELVEKRRIELQQGLIDTETRKVIVELKPVIDQFLFISRIAGDIKKLSKQF